ncbi:MAG: ATP-binding protein [Oligoflexales bacterium]
MLFVNNENRSSYFFNPQLSGVTRIKILEFIYATTPIVYTDNGNGIPAENIDKIFKTSFTAGSKRGRTGLGLSLIKDITKVKSLVQVNL